jgi:pimeloyl-ACP methyl ester carboxylesterase
MARPRILLVPTVTQVEWTIKPLLEEWAEVASYDAPGVGDEPATEVTQEAVVARGLSEIERRGWEDCVVAGDEAGAAQAIRIAGARPSAIRALVLGHAALSFHRTGERPALNGDVFDALLQVARTDYRSFVRALSQITQNAYDDEMVDRFMERVPRELAVGYYEQMFSAPGGGGLERTLRGLRVPMLFVEHRGCLGWTPESFKDAVAAFPEAATASVEIKPSCAPEFAEILRGFCDGLPAQTETAPAERAG